MVLGALGEPGRTVLKRVVLPKRPVLDCVIILRRLMVENLVMALTKTKILAKRIPAQVSSYSSVF